MTELERRVGVERAAPPEVVRQLRVIDPAAELVYFGSGRWMLGRLVPDARIRKAGAALAKSCRNATAGRALVPEDYGRQLMAQLRMQGFQPTTEYVLHGEPTAAIVREQEVMDFLWRHSNDYDRERLADRDYLQRKAETHHDLTDDARARDAYRYLFTRSHAARRINAYAGPRSGFTRVDTRASRSVA